MIKSLREAVEIIITKDVGRTGVEIHKEPPQIVLITDHRDYGDPMVYRIDIADSVFDELQEKGFIRGFPMWGYTSESRFYATETCREYRRAEREKLSFL